MIGRKAPASALVQPSLAKPGLKPALVPGLVPGLVNVDRRRLLRSGLSLGALTMLTGCNLSDGDAVDKALWAVSRFNDRVQAWLFDPNRLAPTFTPAEITDPFPFNAYYPEDNIPEVDGDTWKLEVSGLVQDKVIAHRPFHDVQLRRELSASVMFA